MKKTLTRWIQDAWYNDMYVSVLLAPFSLIYVDIIRLRRFLYRKGLLKSVRLAVPVIVVGNITVGGTGKTPLVIWMANFLQQQGFNPGVISRGYGGQNSEQPRLVTAQTSAAEVGDEAVLIREKAQVPVAVCVKRAVAGQFLIDHENCDILISDDGLQHYALQRNLEIAVIDGERRFGNGYCLPAGPLREPVERLREVDLAIVNGQKQEDFEYAMRFVGSTAVNLQTAAVKPLSDFKAQSCHAVAGIGNPQRFFQLLRQHGLNIKPHAFPDHYPFAAEDLDFNDRQPVLMTEKDAVKCRAFATNNVWAVPIQAKPDSNFIQQLKQRLNLK